MREDITMDEMQRLADLGTALSPTEVPMDRLQAKATPGAPAMAVAAHRSRPRWATPVLVATSVTVLAASAALVAGATGTAGEGQRSGAPPATSSGAVAVKPASFTLVKNADGSVTFTVHNLLDLTGATRALNDAGIVGRVVTSTADCTTGPNVVPINPDDLYPPDTTHRLGERGEVTGSDTVTLKRSYYPPGGGLLVNVDGHYSRQDGKLRLFVAYLAYVDADKIPECINFVDPGTGDVPAWPPQPRRS